MNKKHIITYFQSQQTQFRLNFEPAFVLLNEDAIHDMRVSIKRLRLLYRFLDFFADKQFCAKRKANMLIDVFKLSGSLRDTQIGLTVVEKFQDYLQTDYHIVKENLQQEKKILSTYFKKNQGQFEQIEINRLFFLSETNLKIIVDFPALQQTFDIYKEISLQKLAVLLMLPQVNFHTVRKKVKSLTYLTEIEQIQQTGPSQNLLLLKLMGKLLGEWHDLKIFYQKLFFLKNKKLIMEANFQKTAKNIEEQQKTIIVHFHERLEEYKALN